jgi:hypothetical protein
VRRYVRDLGIRASDLAHGYSELAKLFDGQEPNYNEPGVPIAYAFKYLPRRVALLLGLLDHCPSHILDSFNSVLDVGAGSGAAAIAAEIALPRLLARWHHCEPSAWMTRFFRSLDLRIALETRVSTLRLGEISRHSLKIDAYDLIMLSAALQYDMEVGASLIEGACRVHDVSRRGSRLIVIEPKSKIGIMNRFISVLEHMGWMREMEATTQRESSNGFLPQVTRPKLVLTELNERIGSWAAKLLAQPSLTPEGRAALGFISRRQSEGVQLELWHDGRRFTPYSIDCWNDNPSHYERFAILKRA